MIRPANRGQYIRVREDRTASAARQTGGGGGAAPSHGENRGSSPLGSANYFKHLVEVRRGGKTGRPKINER